MNTKSFWTSKTIWFGVGTFALSVLSWLAGQDYITNNPAAVSVIGAIVGIITIALRTVTNKPLE